MIDTSKFFKVQLISMCKNNNQRKCFTVNFAFESEDQFELLNSDVSFDDQLTTRFDAALPKGWTSDDIIELEKLLESSDKEDVIVTHEMFPIMDSDDDN